MDLPSAIVLQHRHTEITVWFALAGAVLVLVAVGLSQWWNRSAPSAAPAGHATSAAARESRPVGALTTAPGRRPP
jgi:Ca-activated chloride channel family protein